MKNIKNVKFPGALTSLRDQFRLPASGATVSYPGKYPKLLEDAGEMIRGKKGFLGTTITSPPNDNRLYVGLSFETNGKDKEDMVVVDEDTYEINYKGEIERRNELYEGTHHGDKPYLRA